MVRLLIPAPLRAVLDDVAEHRRFCSALLSMPDLNIDTEDAAWRRRLPRSA